MTQVKKGKVELKKLNKSYSDTQIFTNFDLEIPAGSFTTILGPSGCGKSTLLRILSGLEEIDSGELYISEENVTESEPKDRGVAMVFQNYALYPHMSVYKNVEYSLKIKKINKTKRHERVMKALDSVNLSELKDRHPAQLSGGQQQRVALARAIVKEPEVFLMDEPLSNLDAKLRNSMREVISSLHKKLDTTFIFVTHDQSEAMALADNIILLDKGIVMQEGSPKALYTDPNNTYVARFIGNPPMNIIDFSNFSIGIRAEHIKINQSAVNYYKLPTELVDIEFLGSQALYNLNSQYASIIVTEDNRWNQLDQIKSVYLDPSYIKYFDQNGDRIRDELKIKELEDELDKLLGRPV